MKIQLFYHSFCILSFLLVSCQGSRNSVETESGTAMEWQAEPVMQINQEVVPDNLSNPHASMTTDVTADNVDQLNYRYKVETQGPMTHIPIVEDGFAFIADWGGHVYKVNLADGNVQWKKKLYEPKSMWPWHGLAGTGVLVNERLYEVSAEGEAFAINANTGEVIWQKHLPDDPHAGNIGMLLHHGGRIYVGLQSVEEPLSKKMENFQVDFQGKVLALDTATGNVVWEIVLVDPPHTGVPVWSGFALDPSTGTLFFTTGNNYTGEASPLSDAVVAVDANTGELRWKRQMTQHDVWTMAEPKGPDYDFPGAPQLFEAEVDGQLRQLVGVAQKSGVYYSLDRNTGETVWSVTVGYGNVGGGLHAEASIGTDAIFLWGNNSYPYKNPTQHPMDIKAVDAATGKLRWVLPKQQPAQLEAAGFLSNNVYLVPSLDGKVRAYHALDGKKLWEGQDYGSVATSLVVSGDYLLYGAGIPQNYGGNEKPAGLVVWQVKQ